MANVLKQVGSIETQIKDLFTHCRGLVRRLRYLEQENEHLNEDLKSSNALAMEWKRLFEEEGGDVSAVKIPEVVFNSDAMNGTRDTECKKCKLRFRKKDMIPNEKNATFMCQKCYELATDAMNSRDSDDF